MAAYNCLRVVSGFSGKDDRLSDLNTTPLRIHAYIFKERRKSPIAHMTGTHTHTALANTRDPILILLLLLVLSHLILLRTKNINMFLKLIFSPGFIKEPRPFHRTSLKKRNYNRKSSESQQRKWVYTTSAHPLAVWQNELKNLSERQFSYKMKLPKAFPAEKNNGSTMSFHFLHPALEYFFPFAVLRCYLLNYKVSETG